MEELLDGVFLQPTYGNTLMGLAPARPPDSRGWLQDRLLPADAPRGPGGRGPRQRRGCGLREDRPRPRLTTLTREFFVPGFLERDEGEREPPWGPYAWDGVSGVRPFGQLAGGTTVGVY